MRQYQTINLNHEHQESESSGRKMDIQLQSDLRRFRSATEDFCNFIETTLSLSAESFLAGVEIRLLELYVAALSLPVGEPDSEDEENVPFPIDRWAALYQSLKKRLENYDHYWSVFDSRENEDFVDCSLAGDISEFYEDAKESLTVLDKGIPNANVLWDLRFSFRSHWGRHAISALKAIQAWHEP